MEGSSSSKPRLPVDRGWAWFVMVGYFINLYITISWLRSLAILLPIFLDKYQQSTAVTTLAFGIGELVEAAAHVVLSLILIPRVSVRYLALFGTIANVLAILSLSVWSDIVLLNVAFGVIGIARAFLLNPQIFLLGTYFKKRLSFASSIGNTGSSMATISTPLLIQLLLTSYGLEGTFLLFAGIATHSFISSLLFRPTSVYDKVTNSISLSSARDVCSDRDKENDVHKLTPSSYSFPSSSSLSPSVLSVTAPVFINDIMSKDKLIEFNEIKQRDSPDVEHLLVTPTNDNIHDVKIDCKILTSQQNKVNHCCEQCINPTDCNATAAVCSESKMLEGLSNHNTLYDQTRSHIVNNSQAAKSHGLTTDEIDSTAGTWGQPKNGNSLSHKDCHDNTNEIDNPHEHFEILANHGNDSIHPKSRKHDRDANSGCSKCRDVEHDDEDAPKKTATTWEVMKNPTAVLIILAGVFGTQTQCGAIYLPVLGLEQGLSSDQLPWLLTIGGVSDVLGKIIFGFVSDRRWLQPINIACLCLFNAGFVFQLVSYFQGLASMIALSILFSLHAGIIQALQAPISVEYVGLPSLPHIISGVFLGNCILTFLAHLVVGTLKDHTGSFQWSVRFIGALQLTAVVLLVTARWLSSTRRLTSCTLGRVRTSNRKTSSL